MSVTSASRHCSMLFIYDDIMRGSSYAWFITQSRWSKNYIGHKFRVQPPSFISPKIWIHRQLIEFQTLTYIIYGPVVNATFLLNRLCFDNYVNYIAQLHNFLDQHNFSELLWIIARLIYYRSCSNILLFFILSESCLGFVSL